MGCTFPQVYPKGRCRCGLAAAAGLAAWFASGLLLAAATEGPRPSDAVNLSEMAIMARRLGVAGQFATSDEFVESLKQNFLRVYNRHVNRTLFLAYPRAGEVAERIVEVNRAYLELHQGLYVLSTACTQTNGDAPHLGPAHVEALKDVRAASRRLEKAFTGMFLEASPRGARVRPADLYKASGLDGNFCGRLGAMRQVSGALRQRLVGYFFNPEVMSVSLQWLHLPTVRSLTDALDDMAKDLAKRRD